MPSMNYFLIIIVEIYSYLYVVIINKPKVLLSQT
jgi:hypothetical protein